LALHTFWVLSAGIETLTFALLDLAFVRRNSQFSGISTGLFDYVALLALEKLLLSPTYMLFSRGEFLQDEIDSHNLRRVADGFGHRLQAQRTAKHE